MMTHIFPINILEPLSKDFLLFLRDKTNEYITKMIEKNWNEETKSMSEDKQDELTNIGVFKIRLVKELKQRDGESN